MNKCLCVLAVFSLLFLSCKKEMGDRFILHMTKPAYAEFRTPTVFTSNSVGNIYYTIWDFGDGTIDTCQSTLHTYYRSGNYKIKLTVADLHFQHLDSLIDSIRVGIPYLDSIVVTEIPKINPATGEPWKSDNVNGGPNIYFRIKRVDTKGFYENYYSPTYSNITQDSLPLTLKYPGQPIRIGGEGNIYYINIFNKVKNGGLDENMGQATPLNYPLGKKSPCKLNITNPDIILYYTLVQ